MVKMNRLLAIVFLVVVSCSVVMADGLKAGTSIEVLKGNEYQDQFDKPQSIHGDTRTLILTFEKGTGGCVNDFLSKQDKDYLSRHKIQYIADISGMPGLVVSMFALPKMKKYPYIILLNYEDDFQEKVPHEKGKVTLISLDEKQNVVSTVFVEKQEAALESALAVAPTAQ